MSKTAAPLSRRWLRSLAGVQDLTTLRSRLLDNVVFLLALAATPGATLSVLRAQELGWQPFMTAQLVVLASIWVFYFSLGRLGFVARVWILSTILFVAAIAGTVQLGPAADARFFLVFITLLLGLLVGAPAALVSVSVNFLAMASLGFFAVEVGLPLVIDYSVYVRRPSTWWSITYTLSVYGGVIAYVSASLLQHLNDSAAALRSQTRLGENILKAQSAFIRAESPSQAFGGLLDDLLTLTHSEYGFVGEVIMDGAGQPFLRTYAITDIAWDEASRALFDAGSRGGMEFRNMDTLFGAAITTGEVVISNTPSSDPRGGGLPPGHPAMSAYLGIPVLKNGKVVALLGLANRPKGYDADLVQYLQPLVATVGQLIDAMHAKRIKDEFVSVVSHELRTPLTSISGALGLVSSGAVGELSKQAESLLAIASKNSTRLARLIDDLLDMDKLASGKFRISLSRQPVMPLVEQAVEANRSYGAERGVVLRILASDAVVDVEVDGDRLQQVLSNLLSNAIKFSPDDGEVAVSVVTRDGAVRLEVCDQGPGVPDAFHAHVFDKFSQADSSDTRAAGGTGLGLAIARELVERMGGVIGFESLTGQGARFHVDLPIAGMR